ncbi:hypothetical protein [Sphingobium sp.]|uniref:8-oxoguanine DNA glycosylase OGG fold protein n=1 Tax=Sphingobium sp. TaxID=1912891 RepID=UPI0035C6C125
MQLNDLHLAALRGMAFQPNGPGGVMPSTWADAALDRWNGFDPPLPPRRFDRRELRAYCLDPDTPVFHAFVAIMAWGGQEARSRKFREAIEARQDVLETALYRLREGQARAKAYDSWSGLIWGLGPSFLTKVIAFMSPTEDVAIMDQWAVKALHLLYGTRIVHLSPPKGEDRRASPTNKNDGGRYDAYCAHLEHLRDALGLRSVLDTEERIFCRPGGMWRKYVRLNWHP